MKKGERALKRYGIIIGISLLALITACVPRNVQSTVMAKNYMGPVEHRGYLAAHWYGNPCWELTLLAGKKEYKRCVSETDWKHARLGDLFQGENWDQN